MAMTKCEGCGEERDVDGQMYDFGPTIACGQCWLSLLRFIRVGTPPTEKPDYWKRQYAMAVERAVEAEKAHDALEGELQRVRDLYKATLADRNAALARIRAFEEAYGDDAPTGFDRVHGRTGRK